MPHITTFTVYNLLVGLVSTLGVIYLLYHQFAGRRYRRFLTFLGTGFLIFSVGGPLIDIVAPSWVHLVHGIAALFVVFGLYDPVKNDLRRDEWIELLFREPGEVRHPAEWMRPMDERILELFRSSDLVLSPTIVAYNLGYSSKEVNRRLSTLSDHHFVERVERGKYRITDIGAHYLEGRTAPEENLQHAAELTDQ